MFGCAHSREAESKPIGHRLLGRAGKQTNLANQGCGYGAATRRFCRQADRTRSLPGRANARLPAIPAAHICGTICEKLVLAE